MRGPSTTRGALTLLILLFASAHCQALDIQLDHALGRPTTQSSTAFGGSPGLAVDGNVDGAFADHSVTHTDHDPFPWWQVDLQDWRYIAAVRIYGRTDPCCASRLKNVFVFFSDHPFATSVPSDTMVESGVTFSVIWGQATSPYQELTVERTARYVRVQLAGSDFLSLAEVQVLDRINHISGPDAIAAHTSWVPTDVTTAASGLALVEAWDSLRAYARGGDGTLHESVDLAASTGIPGSPMLTLDPVAAAVDEASGHVFVAVHTAAGDAAIAEGAPDPTGAIAWTWTTLGPTDGAPALAVGCSRLYVAVRNGGQVQTNSRWLKSSSWDGWVTNATTRSIPRLAINAQDAVGLAYIATNDAIFFSENTCSGGVSWSPPVWTGGTSKGAYASIAAYANLFAVAVQGIDAFPYFQSQAMRKVRDPAGGVTFEAFWPGFERVETEHGTIALSEPPTLVVFRGLTFVAARDTQSALRYWVRNPNTLLHQSGPMWQGGSVVGGAGTGATPPAFSVRGSTSLVGSMWGSTMSPAELYVATRGIADQRIYALNFGRYAAVDVLATQNGMVINTAFGANGIPPETVANIFEFLAAFMTLPAHEWSRLPHPAPCSGAPLTLLMGSNFDRAGWSVESCSPRNFPDGRSAPGPAVFLGTSYPAWTLFEELGHLVQFADSDLTSDADYQRIFNKLDAKKCETDADCGGDQCAVGGDGASYFDDPLIRRWIDVKICQHDGVPQGYVTWYDLSEGEHNFLDFLEMYRYFGDELRSKRDREVNEGNRTLDDKYAFLRDRFYRGVEFNGSQLTAASGERSAGSFALPER
jgi:hypothetical protein